MKSLCIQQCQYLFFGDRLDEFYTIEDLKVRGWTEAIIRDHLGKPDKEDPDKGSSLRKPIGFYLRERLHEAEQGAAKNDLAKNREGRELAKRALRLKKQRELDRRRRN